MPDIRVSDSESTETFLTVSYCSQISMYLSISYSLCSAVHVNHCAGESLCRRSSRSPTMLSILLVVAAATVRGNTRVVRRALNLLRASFSPIFQYFSAVNAC